MSEQPENTASVFDAPLRDVGELTDEDTKDTENDDNVDNDATTQQDSPIDDIPMSNACQQGCINLVDPSGHDNPPHTGDNTASSHQTGDDNNNDNEGDEGGSNEGGEGDMVRVVRRRRLTLLIRKTQDVKR